MQKSSEIEWVTVDRHPSPSKMTSVGKISADVARIKMGEKGNMNDLLFTDPSSFRAGEIHKHSTFQCGSAFWKTTRSRSKYYSGCSMEWIRDFLPENT